MLISQAIIQTPIIFGFVIATLIYNQLPTVITMTHGIKFLASGLSIGLGSIGPCLGLAYFARTACASIGINPHAYPKIFSFTFISQAIIETPIIFSLVISVLLAFRIIPADAPPTLGIMLLMAALCMGLGTLGAGISSGRTAASACHQIALNPDNQALLARLSMIAQGLIDTCAIYPLLISLLLIFW
jgi:F-type H+-transporting ATPase subunit c